MANWAYSAILTLIFTTTALGVEATDAKREAKVATCKTEEIQKELDTANAKIKALEAAVEELKKQLSGK